MGALIAPLGVINQPVFVCVRQWYDSPNSGHLPLVTDPEINILYERAALARAPIHTGFG